MNPQDFKPGGLLTPENIGEKSMNVLGIPDELLDLNKISSEKIIPK